MLNGRTLWVLIACPSDVKDERAAVTDIIRHWNSRRADQTGITLEPRDWYIDGTPGYEGEKDIQQLLNEDVVDTCDLVIAIFHSRLGTSTLRSASGTLEEIERFTEAKKPVAVYFSDKPLPPSAIDPEQLVKLNQFKKQFRQHGLAYEYETLADFREKLRNHIETLVKKTVGRMEGSNREPLTNLKNAWTLGNVTTATPHQKRIDGIAREVADGYGPPEMPHVVAMMSLDFWLVATPKWRATHKQPTLLFSARNEPDTNDVTILRDHCPNLPIWSEYDKTNPVAIGKFINHLWSTLEKMMAQAELLTNLKAVRPTSWQYSNLDVRTSSPGLTSGFFASLFFVATKRELIRLGIPGFFEWPGESMPLLTYETAETHLWAAVPVKSDTPIGPVQHPILREATRRSDQLSGFRWHKIPIAHTHCGEQLERVKESHRELASLYRNDREFAVLCEEWLDVWDWWTILVEGFRNISPETLESPTCKECVNVDK